MQALGILVAVVGAALLVALSVLHSRHYARFVKHLELNHHEHWKSVGSPAQFEDEPQYGSFGYSAYFSDRRYAELGDQELATLGDKMLGKRKWMLVSLAIIVVGVGIANGGIV